jgi:hypothetical protein
LKNWSKKVTISLTNLKQKWNSKSQIGSPPAESMTSPTKITLLKNRYKHELADIRMEDKVKKIQPNTAMQNKNMKKVTMSLTN